MGHPGQPVAGQTGWGQWRPDRSTGKTQPPRQHAGSVEGEYPHPGKRQRNPRELVHRHIIGIGSHAEFGIVVHLGGVNLEGVPKVCAGWIRGGRNRDALKEGAGAGKFGRANWLRSQRPAIGSYRTIGSPSFSASHGPPKPDQRVLVLAGPNNTVPLLLKMAKDRLTIWT